MKRPFTRFIGVDLGGGRGKTTAIAVIERSTPGPLVVEVATRASSRQPWTDETLFERLIELDHGSTVVAIDAPLTAPACTRCELVVCPGTAACVDPAVVWLRNEGRQLVRQAAAESAAANSPRGFRTTGTAAPQARLAPYAHRATDVVLAYQRALLPVSSLTAPTGPIASRARHLCRRLADRYQLHRNLLEVSPVATVTALCGSRAARGYKHDADPWHTRALILERTPDLAFHPRSRLAREDVLQNDHGFDAMISAYTAYLWARDGWETPNGWLAADGWIAAPP